MIGALGAVVSPPPSLFDAMVLGLVEGVTEFLPISSTGHLIVAQRLLGHAAGGDNNVFAIGIQMGAITAILVLYWRRLFAALRTAARPTAGAPNLLWQIAIAAFPAAFLGLLCDDWIDQNLFSARVVAATLLLGGVLLLWLEALLRRRGGGAGGELAQMSYRTALWIGLFQCLALVPGTSRAGATIAGALLLGLSRTAAAEFSFLVGLPILYGASLYKLASRPELLTGEAMPSFAVGTLVSFLSALVVVRPFVLFLRQHTFAPFAWYRIGAGLLLALLCASGYLA
ncbi:MAG: undecaprenyl-diphosphate phosphatase [Planctomycetes bacterium]|nr:undecaprenyl-diphosphate phosphatase [Planctomycetota bacterium]